MKKVVFYARVSTDSNVQLHSLEEQRKFFLKFINENKEYDFAGEYVDEGISGTSMNKRDAFNRMIFDGMRNKFDLILVKDISRFSRNTLDTIEQTRMLKAHGIDVIFINDHIDTRKSDGELNLTLLATMAQEESRKTSNRVNWTMQSEIKKGVMYLTSLYGYEIIDRQLYINEDEAKVVRFIFELYLNSYGLRRISNKLFELKIKSPKGKERWDIHTISRILSNEKYMGTLISGKTHVEDYLTHKAINVPKEKQYVFENHHDAIVSKENFYKVQDEMKRRRTYTERHPDVFGGKIQCGCCGTFYSRESSKKLHYYCNNMQLNHGCHNHNSVYVPQMRLIIKTVLMDFFDKDKVHNKVIQSIKQSQANNRFHDEEIYCEKNKNRLNQKKIENLERFLSEEILLDEYQQIEKEINKELQTIIQKLEKLSLQNKEKTYLTALDELNIEISSILKNDSLYEQLIRTHIDKIIFRNRNDFDIYMNTSSFKLKSFSKEKYEFITTLNYDFSRFQIDVSPYKYKNFKVSTIKLYVLGGL